MSRLIHYLRPLVLLPLALVLASCGGRGVDTEVGTDQVATLELDAAYPEPFSFLATVRELSDGRVLAADPLSQVLLRVDLEAGSADTLGGLGGGPGEYQQPDQVFPLAGDSTLLVDIGKTYLTVVGPDGTLHDGIPMTVGTDEGPPDIIMPRAADGSGGIYHETRGVMGEGPPDSTTIARYDWSTRRTDTAAVLWRPEPIISRSGGNVRMMSPQMEGRDDWAVGKDGRVAVVRANGYRVEWLMPDGQVISGPENAFETFPIADEDKERFLEERNSGSLMMMITSGGSGGGSMTMSRGGMHMGGGEGPTMDDFEWATEFPAFRPNRTRVSLQNEAWVQRWLPSAQPQAMDVFGPDGAWKGSVPLPARTQVLGFGRGPRGDEVAYLVRTDEFDLKWLERHRVVR
jgi:hypothetical protein